jgi:2-hydroxychromene-2-carboxylate isomerase
MSRRRTSRESIVGELIDLAAHRAARQHGRETHQQHRAVTPRRATFYFDLASPFTYLAVERVERLFPNVRWQPVLADALQAGDAWADEVQRAALMSAAEERARTMRLPLVWPERFPQEARAAMRVAAHAAAQERAGAFALAAARLAFCGGFDLDDPEVLAEAAAAASLNLPDALAAARDSALDGQLEETGLRLLARGATALPALRVTRTLFCGEDRVAEAAAAMRMPAVALTG